MTTTTPVEKIAYLDYRIPLRPDLGVLPARIQPVEHELLRSYFARIAEANCVTTRELLKAIQPDPAEHRTFPSDFGVVIDEEYATQLADTLRCHSEEIVSCLLRERDGVDFSSDGHPYRLRACAECQVTDGAWRRWNADPLCIVCPIHHTMLWDTSPDGQTNTVVLLLRAKKADWRGRLGKPSPRLFQLQEELLNLRKTAMYKSPDNGPSTIVYQSVWLYRKALTRLQTEPICDAEANYMQTMLHQYAWDGWAEVERIGRQPTPPQLTKGTGGTRSVGTFRAEDLAAILPATVAAAEAALKGDNSEFWCLYENMFSISGYRHAPDLSRFDNEASEVIGVEPKDPVRR